MSQHFLMICPTGYELTFSKRYIVPLSAFITLLPNFWNQCTSENWIVLCSQLDFKIDAANVFCKQLQRCSWRTRMSFLRRLFFLLKGNVQVHFIFRAVKSARRSDIELPVTEIKWSTIQINKHSLVFLYRFSPKMISNKLMAVVKTAKWKGK